MMASGGAQVHYVVDAERSIRYQNMEVTCNGEPFQFQLVKDTEAEPADLVLTAVKGTGLPSALNTMAGCVGPETVIISVLNGISSEGILGERFGKEKMIHTVAQGMDAMKFGSKLQYTQTGNLHIGLAPGERAENLDAVKTFFDRTGVGYVEEDDIMRRMWSKFMLNVGVNQTCMVYGTTYGGVLADGEPNRTMISAMREVIALAGAEGILLNEQDLNQYIDIIGTWVFGVPLGLLSAFVWELGGNTVHGTGPDQPEAIRSGAVRRHRDSAGRKTRTLCAGQPVPV